LIRLPDRMSNLFASDTFEETSSIESLEGSLSDTQ
jgi:hypothetical protein